MLTKSKKHSSYITDTRTAKSILYKIVEESDTTSGKVFNLFIQVIIILSIVSFSISTLPDISSGLAGLIRYFEYFSINIFTVEYLLRVYLAKRKNHYVFGFYGIIDLLAILPFYLSFGIDLRSLRVFRLFRIFRLFKLLRYNSALERLKQSFLKVKEELFIYLFATFFLIYLSSVGIYYFENGSQPEHFKSVFHSLWWAVATLTTVGYGDIYPVTVGGKIFTFIILLLGIGIVAVPTGLLASVLTRSKE